MKRCAGGLVSGAVDFGESAKQQVGRRARASVDKSGFIWDGLTGCVMSSVLADKKGVGSLHSLAGLQK
jgi:hypothetical protein